MTERQLRRLDVFRRKLEGHVEMNRAPDQPILTINAVRDLGAGRAVIDYIDHTKPGDPLRHDEIDLDVVPDEDDDSLAEIYLQNLIEDLLSVD